MGRTGTLRLARATEGDLEAVGATTVEAYAPFLLGPDDPYAVRLRDARTRAREAELWVARLDAGTGAAVVGSVTTCPPGSPWREVAAREDPAEGEFRMLAVAPAAQGRGIGDALVRLALDRAAGHGARRVRISSLARMDRAHRLYARHGFLRDPAHDWTPAPGVRLITFRLDLEEPA